MGDDFSLQALGPPRHGMVGDLAQDLYRLLIIKLNA